MRLCCYFLGGRYGSNNADEAKVGDGCYAVAVMVVVVVIVVLLMMVEMMVGGGDDLRSGGDKC